jgi:hypothetical protein
MTRDEDSPEKLLASFKDHIRSSPDVPREIKDKIASGDLVPVMHRIPLDEGEEAFISALGALCAEQASAGIPSRATVEIIADAVKDYGLKNNLLLKDAQRIGRSVIDAMVLVFNTKDEMIN